MRALAGEEEENFADFAAGCILSDVEVSLALRHDFPALQWGMKTYLLPKVHSEEQEEEGDAVGDEPADISAVSLSADSLRSYVWQELKSLSEVALAAQGEHAPNEDSVSSFWEANLPPLLNYLEVPSVIVRQQAAVGKGRTEAERTDQDDWGDGNWEGHFLLTRMGLNGVIRQSGYVYPNSDCEGSDLLTEFETPIGAWVDAQKLGGYKHTEVDVILSYNGVHYNWIHPVTKKLHVEAPWGNCLFESIAAAAVVSRSIRESARRKPGLESHAVLASGYHHAIADLHLLLSTLSLKACIQCDNQVSVQVGDADNDVSVSLAFDYSQASRMFTWKDPELALSSGYTGDTGDIFYVVAKATESRLRFRTSISDIERRDRHEVYDGTVDSRMNGLGEGYDSGGDGGERPGGEQEPGASSTCGEGSRGEEEADFSQMYCEEQVLLHCAKHAFNNAHGAALATLEQFAEHQSVEKKKPDGPWSANQILDVSADLNLDACALGGEQRGMNVVSEILRAPEVSAVVLLKAHSNHWIALKRLPGGDFVRLDSVEDKVFGRVYPFSARDAASTVHEILEQKPFKGWAVAVGPGTLGSIKSFLKKSRRAQVTKFGPEHEHEGDKVDLVSASSEDYVQDGSTDAQDGSNEKEASGEKEMIKAMLLNGFCSADAGLGDPLTYKEFAMLCAINDPLQAEVAMLLQKRVESDSVVLSYQGIDLKLLESAAQQLQNESKIVLSRNGPQHTEGRVVISEDLWQTKISAKEKSTHPCSAKGREKAAAKAFQADAELKERQARGKAEDATAKAAQSWHRVEQARISSEKDFRECSEKFASMQKTAISGVRLEKVKTQQTRVEAAEKELREEELRMINARRMEHQGQAEFMTCFTHEASQAPSADGSAPHLCPGRITLKKVEGGAHVFVSRQATNPNSNQAGVPMDEVGNRPRTRS